MIKELEGRLRFKAIEIDRFNGYQSSNAPMHDSRSGLGFMYRYCPRPIGKSPETDGGPPIVHFSVVERMLQGLDDYAPVTLPASAKVMLPNGDVIALADDRARTAIKAAYLSITPIGDEHTIAAAASFESILVPDDEMVELTLDAVWWRRFANLCLITMIGLLAFWPWIIQQLNNSLSEWTTRSNAATETILNIDSFLPKPVAILKFLSDIAKLAGEVVFTVLLTLRGLFPSDASWLKPVLTSVFGPAANVLQTFAPTYADRWIGTLTSFPSATLVAFLLATLIWRAVGQIRDSIRVRARLAWNRPGRRASRYTLKPFWLKIGRVPRRYGQFASRIFTNLVLPGILFSAFFFTVLIVGSNSFFSARVALGMVCQPSGEGKPVLGGQPIAARGSFATNDFCWWSGLTVEKGGKYRVWIEMEAPWFDGTTMTGVNGYPSHDMEQYKRLPLRRLLGADWFQPVARVGSKWLNEQPLEAINVKETRSPVRLDATGASNGNLNSLGQLDPIPQDMLADAGQVWRSEGLTDHIVAEFIAPDSGELFFYVNDAVQIFPQLLPESMVPSWLMVIQGPPDLFYRNNTGTAKISVQRLPTPALPSAKTTSPLASK